MVSASARSLNRREVHLTKPASSCSSFLGKVFLLLASLAPLGAITGCTGLVSSGSTTGNPPPPSTLVITNVQTGSITTSSSQVVWTTNVPADSSVDYGTTTAYGNSTPVDSAMVTSHQMTLSGLAAGTTYYYQVNSTDSKGNHGHGGNKFNTAGFSLSGAITPATGGSGATVALSGAATATTTANSSGVYTFTRLVSGSYTITPSNLGYTFSPASQSVSLSTANITGVNFTDAAVAVAPTITLSPTFVSLSAGGTQQFTATVSGTTNTAVTWSATGGSISSGGLYTAPSTAGTYTVQATSVADNTKSASATVAVSAAVVTISISPTSASLATGGTQQFTATVSGTTNTAVTWSVTGGSISSGGLYTAPSTAGTYTVQATSVADNTKSASATVAVSAAVVTISISPTSVSLATGGTQQFTATVSGNSNTAVTWSATGGTISASGLYTASSTAGSYAVKATSLADSTKSASATVTVSSLPSFGHVFIVVEENTDYSSVVGSSSMPYLNSLISQYGLATNYYADTHPSIGNYMALTTGQILTNDDRIIRRRPEPTMSVMIRCSI